MKVYCYFLKEYPDELYAFTINKKFKSEFEIVRNMDLFIYGIKELSDEEFKIFSYKNQKCMLTTDYVTSENTDFEIVVTYNETDKISSSCEYICDTLESIKDSALNKELTLSDEDLNFIIEITELLTYSKNKKFLNINTLKLFYEVCKETFNKDYDIIRRN